MFSDSEKQPKNLEETHKNTEHPAQKEARAHGFTGNCRSVRLPTMPQHKVYLKKVFALE